MAVNDVQIPPIRTNLDDPDVAGQTAKEWYLYWQQSGQRINTLNGMVTWGNSGDRLDPSVAPDGAIYVESDRGGIIYQNQGGEWHYIAGTMWGTISPDQRPADLGVNDAGFEFRSIDTDPLLGGHEWIWSGTAWIEVTPNRYGPHADRLALTLADTWNGMIWVETDRSGVIYQNQSGAWHYLAGTMDGTLAPDQRPGGLGANDAGFTFRAIDTAPQSAARTFVWSGTVWVETTPARFDLHANRVASTNLENGTLWVETDRSEVLYQLQGTAWHFISGTMWGTISPDQRPTDLGANDAGFQFRGTDQVREFVWSGTTWIETTPAQAGDVQIAGASGAVTLTTVPQDLGVSITLNRAGRYYLNGVFDLRGSGDIGQLLIGQCVADGAVQGKLAFISCGASADGASISQQWMYTAPAIGKIVKLQAYKTGGTGGSSAQAQSTLSALWISA